MPDVIGDYNQIGGDAFPDAGLLRPTSQVLIVDRTTSYKTTTVDDVTEAEIKVTVHALQGRDHQTVGDRRYAKAPASDINRACPLRQRSSENHLLSCLPQTTHVDFNRLGKARDEEVPLTGETISPTARRDPSLEASLHEVDDRGWFGVRVKVKVAAQVGPVIERLNHRYIFSLFLERIADGVEEGQRISDASAFRVERGHGPGCTHLIADGSHNVKNAFHSPHNHMVRAGERC